MVHVLPWGSDGTLASCTCKFTARSRCNNRGAHNDVQTTAWLFDAWSNSASLRTEKVRTCMFCPEESETLSGEVVTYTPLARFVSKTSCLFATLLKYVLAYGASTNALRRNVCETSTRLHLRAESRDGDGVFGGAHVERGNWDLKPVTLTKSDADFVDVGAEFVKGYSKGDFTMEELNDFIANSGIPTYIVTSAGGRIRPVRNLEKQRRDEGKLALALDNTHTIFWIRAIRTSRWAEAGQLLGFARATSDGVYNAVIWDVAVRALPSSTCTNPGIQRQIAYRIIFNDLLFIYVPSTYIVNTVIILPSLPNLATFSQFAPLLLYCVENQPARSMATGAGYASLAGLRPGACNAGETSCQLGRGRDCKHHSLC
eukprot:1178218-Prorocentrum_minimum.AAC.1